MAFSVKLSPSELLIQLLYPPQVPAAFERSSQPRVDDRNRHLRADDTLADRDHVGVVVLATEAGGFFIEAIGAPHAFHAVGGHRFAVARAAEDDTALAVAACDGLSRGADEVGIID